ncbi:targeting protein for Xklp2-like [Frieseomelitta varia]|uniref:targeting protein for Xklp2-like n=1 Tax=Frieseomelitta varia TaxID=561572 RepID=UPI001CB67FF8|nr:targeting protein for Xklp2-like [Frieseomelitta varia]
MASSSSVNKNHPQTSTPIAYTKDNSKILPRKLWQTKNAKPEFENDNSNMYRNLDKDEKWDMIESPQFVDFTNPPDIEDSFFNKSTAVVSMQNSTFANTEYPNTTPNDNTLIVSFNDLSLSSIKYDDADDEKTCVNDNLQKQETEEYVVHSNNIKLEPEINTKICNKVKKEVYPFTFDLRDQEKQKQKEEHLKKLLEEETKVRIFRANPLPNFIKSRTKTINNRRNNNEKKNEENKLINDKNKPTSNNLNQKVQESDNCDKQSGKNIEVWKKPPFVPRLAKRMLQLPKTPPLHTVTRAQERKQFDDTVKEKERLREEKRQMEIAAKKKQEEEEISLLRKRTVHKAQPIPKYKSNLPKVEKRPLTDPVSPLVMKRRRCT